MKTHKDIKFHELADVFPFMPGSEVDDLAEDIKKNGLLNPITLYEEKIIDGRHRYKACLIAGVDPKFVELQEGLDPTAFVIAQNLHRRHLDASQRGMVAGRLATLKRTDTLKKGSNYPDGSIDLTGKSSIEDAARLLNVGEATVKRAKQVIEKGSAELIRAVDKGDVPVSVAAQLVSTEPSKAVQAEVVKQGSDAVKNHIEKRQEVLPNPKAVKLCSTAMEFASLAISQLQRIRQDDDQIVPALNRVVSWIEKKKEELE